MGDDTPPMCDLPDACLVCYEHRPPPIRTGCGCRGTNGWAHVDCLARAARFQQAHRGETVWGECHICERAFSGEMLVFLAEAWVAACDELPARDPTARFRALGHLSTCRLKQGRYADAERINWELLERLTRERGEGHLQTMVCAGDLALSLSYTRKFAAANRLFADVTRAIVATYGAHHPDALLIQSNHVSSLLLQGRYRAAERLARSLVGVLERVLGATHAYTLACTGNLATALSKQGKRDEAGGVHRRLIATQQRVLGADHPDTRMATRMYASAHAATTDAT